MFAVQMPSTSPFLSGLTSGITAGSGLAKLPSTINYYKALANAAGMKNTPASNLLQLHALYQSATDPATKAMLGAAINKQIAVSRGMNISMGGPTGTQISTGGMAGATAPGVTFGAGGPVLAGQGANGQSDPNATTANPYSVSSRSMKGAQYIQTDPNNPQNAVQQNSPTTGAQTLNQAREQGLAELPIISHQIIKGIAPYNSALTGGPHLAWDSLQASPLGKFLGFSPADQQSALGRLSNYAGAVALGTDQGALQARVAGNPKPGVEITNENMQNTMGRALHPVFRGLMPQAANNAAIPIQLNTVKQAASAAALTNAANYPQLINQQDLSYAGGNPARLAQVTSSALPSTSGVNGGTDPTHQAIINELAFRQAQEAANGSK